MVIEILLFTLKYFIFCILLAFAYICAEKLKNYEGNNKILLALSFPIKACCFLCSIPAIFVSVCMATFICVGYLFITTKNPNLSMWIVSFIGIYLGMVISYGTYTEFFKNSDFNCKAFFGKTYTTYDIIDFIKKNNELNEEQKEEICHSIKQARIKNL